MRASLCAVAVMALGAPRCAFFRRRRGPRALSERCSALAARFALGLVRELPAGDAVVGAQPQPGGEVLGAGPFGHIGANLADHLQGCVRVHAFDPGQIHSRHPVRLALDLETGRVLPIALFAVGSRRLAVGAVFKTLQPGFNLPVAPGNPILTEPVQFRGLGQFKLERRPVYEAKLKPR